MRKWIWILFCLAAITATAQQSSGLKNIIQHYLDSTQVANGYPGMTLTYIVGNQPPVNLATGMADKEAGVAMKPNDIMLSGSTPKMFYSVVVMQLVKQSKIKLDDRIEKYLGNKSWFSRLPNSKDITIQNLLQHTSGVPEYYTYGDFLKRIINEPDRTWTLEELIGYILDQPAKTKAGEHFEYADTNYLLLGLIVEAVTGTDMYALVEKQVLRPLQLRNTKPSNSRKLPGLITGYSMPKSLFGFSGPTISNGQFVVNPQFELMGGGYISNTEDWALFAKALFEGKIVDTATLHLMQKSIPANTGRDHQYGLGLQVRPSAYGLGYGHGGWFPGYLTEVEYFPQKEITIAVQCNTDDFSKVKGQLRGHVVRILKLIAEN